MGIGVLKRYHKTYKTKTNSGEPSPVVMRPNEDPTIVIDKAIESNTRQSFISPDITQQPNGEN